MRLTFNVVSNKEIDDIIALFKDEDFFILSFADKEGDVAHERNALFVSDGLLAKFDLSDKMSLFHHVAYPQWGRPAIGISLKANGMVFTKGKGIRTDNLFRAMPFPSKYLDKIAAQLKVITEFKRDATATAIGPLEILQMAESK